MVLDVASIEAKPFIKVVTSMILDLVSWLTLSGFLIWQLFRVQGEPKGRKKDALEEDATNDEKDRQLAMGVDKYSVVLRFASILYLVLFALLLVALTDDMSVQPYLSYTIRGWYLDLFVEIAFAIILALLVPATFLIFLTITDDDHSRNVTSMDGLLPLVVKAALLTFINLVVVSVSITIHWYVLSQSTWTKPVCDQPDVFFGHESCNPICKVHWFYDPSYCVEWETAKFSIAVPWIQVLRVSAMMGSALFSSICIGPGLIWKLVSSIRRLQNCLVGKAKDSDEDRANERTVQIIHAAKGESLRELGFDINRRRHEESNMRRRVGGHRGFKALAKKMAISRQTCEWRASAFALLVHQYELNVLTADKSSTIEKTFAWIRLVFAILMIIAVTVIVVMWGIVAVSLTDPPDWLKYRSHPLGLLATWLTEVGRPLVYPIVLATFVFYCFISLSGFRLWCNLLPFLDPFRPSILKNMNDYETNICALILNFSALSLSGFVCTLFGLSGIGTACYENFVNPTALYYPNATFVYACVYVSSLAVASILICFQYPFDFRFGLSTKDSPTTFARRVQELKQRWNGDKKKKKRNTDDIFNRGVNKAAAEVTKNAVSTKAAGGF